MSDPRKHHYLPQFYLRGFSEDEASLYQIEKQTGRSYGCRIKDIAAIRDFHEIDAEAVDDPLALERELAKIEGELSVHLRDFLCDGIGNERALVETVGLVSLLRMRVPAVKRYIEASLEQTVRQMAEAMEKRGLLPPAPEGLEEHLRIANLQIQISNWKCLELMFGMSSNPDVLATLRSMRPLLFRAPAGHRFVTCDQPVALFHRDAKSPYGVGPATPGVEISLPLSSTSLLLLVHGEGEKEERVASVREVEEFNRRTIIMAEQYVFTAAVLEEIAARAYELREQAAGFRFDMIEGGRGIYQIHRCLPVHPAV